MSPEPGLILGLRRFGKHVLVRNVLAQGVAAARNPQTAEMLAKTASRNLVEDAMQRSLRRNVVHQDFGTNISSSD